MDRLNVLQRLNEVQKKVDYIQKEKKQGMRYSIVSHDAVTAKVRPALVEAGVLYYPVAMNRSHNGNRCELDMTVRFVAIDDAADYIDVVTGGYGIDDSDKGVGKAISYAMKYALLKALGMETGDDPDEDQGSHHVSSTEQKARDKIAASGARSGAAMVEHAGEQWREWAMGADAAKWLKDSAALIALMATPEEVGKWRNIADSRKRIEALDLHFPERCDWIMAKVNARLEALGATGPLRDKGGRAMSPLDAG